MKKIIFKSIVGLLLLYGLYLLCAIFAFGGGCNNMKAETHILTKGFTGKVYVFFDQKGSSAKEYDKETRIYRIPQSGILLTEFKENSGWIDSKKYLNFYYEDVDSLIMINKFISGRDSLTDLDSNTVVVFEYGIGVGWDSFGKGELHAASYIVDSLKNFKKRDYSLTKEMFDNWNKPEPKNE